MASIHAAQAPSGRWPFPGLTPGTTCVFFSTHPHLRGRVCKVNAVYFINNKEMALSQTG